MWHVHAFLALLVISSVVALTIGGAPERLVAATLLIAVALSHLSHAFPPKFVRPDLALLAIDASATGVVVAIALRANRFWPIWIATLLIQSILGHTLRIADATLFPWLYWLTCTVWAWPIQAILLVGAIQQYRSTRERSWSDFSSPSAAFVPAKGPNGS